MFPTKFVVATYDRKPTTLPQNVQVILKKNSVQVNYLPAHFVAGDVACAVATLSCENARLLSVEFPPQFIRACTTSKLGITGIRKFLNILNRPFVCFSFDAENSTNCSTSLVGGADIVVSNGCEKNFARTLALRIQEREKAQRITGERKLLVQDITGNPTDLQKRILECEKQGCAAVFIHPTVGFGTLQWIRKMTDLILVSSIEKSSTLSPEVQVLLFRLSGVDAVLCSNELATVCVENNLFPICQVQFQELFSVIEQTRDFGFLHDGNAVSSANIRTLAAATRQALAAGLHEIPLKEYSSVHYELQDVLQQISPTRSVRR